MAAAKRKIRGTIEDDDEETDDQANEEAALFADYVGRGAKKIDKVSVRRTDPNSGFLGFTPPDVNEAQIFERWGGGEYRLDARNVLNAILKVRTVKIAGDPLFESEAEENRWRRLNGLQPRARSAAAGAGGGTDVKDLLVMMEERDERRRLELEQREERARKDAAEREAHERHLREERDVLARRETDERESRRRLEAREDEERRTRAHREDMERLAAQNAQAMQQAQQYFTQLAAAMKSEAAAGERSDPVKTLIAGVQLAQSLGGGGGDAAPADFLTTLVSRLPETLQEVRRTAGGVMAELKGGAGGKRGRATGAKPGEDYLTITGPTASKAKRVIKALAAAGKNPEAELDRMLTFAAAAAESARPAAAPAAPASSTKAAPTQVTRAAAKIARKPSRSSPRRRAAPRARRGAA
jgi:hypothetical protein